MRLAEIQREAVAGEPQEWTVSLTGRNFETFKNVHAITPISSDPKVNAAELREAREALTSLGLDQFAEIGVGLSKDPRSRGTLQRMLVWREGYAHTVDFHTASSVRGRSLRTVGVSMNFKRAEVASARVA